LPLRWLIPLGVILALALLSLYWLPPGGKIIAGWFITTVGAILFLSGFGVGAYIAFTEDSLYAIGFVLIPPYTAYYFVSRWEEMRTLLALVIVGVALLSIGRWAMVSGASEQAAVEQSETEARSVVPLRPALRA
jgi:hypothetical protein